MIEAPLDISDLAGAVFDVCKVLNATSRTCASQTTCSLAENRCCRRMEKTKAVPGQIGRVLILCVDDNKTGLRLLNDILVKDGFAVLQASTAEESLEMVREAPVCLIVADHVLRGSLGAELAGKFKAIKPTVPVVLHSGTNPDSMRHVDAFIHKGESVNELLALIRDLVKRFSS